VFKIREIMELLPHRYPFLLVDRIVEWDPGKRIVGIKNVTINEPFFQGHFPGHPIMPGVLIVEALAQAGGILALKAMGGGKRIAYFTGIDNCKFRRPVVPGDQLRLEITVIARKGPMWKMHGEALVNGVIAAKGDVTATIPDGIEPGGPGDEE
jgi:beta-hydroxyacyl-ACP dehydratase FabZ